MLPIWLNNSIWFIWMLFFIHEMATFIKVWSEKYTYTWFGIVTRYVFIIFSIFWFCYKYYN